MKTVSLSSMLIAISLFAYPCFSWYLPTSFSIFLCLASLVLLLASFPISRFNLACGGVSSLWIAFAFILAISCVLNSKSFQMAPLMMVFYAFAGYLLISRNDWVDAVFRIMLIMTLAHAVATILFYVFPDAYAPLKAMAFPDSRDANGYESGLTSHYSYNGDLLGIGVVLSFSYLLFYKKGGKGRIVQFVLCAVFAIALVLCAKRAHLAFSVVALVLVYTTLSRSNARLTKVVIFACVALILAFALAPFIPGLSATLDRFLMSFDATSAEDLTSNRTLLWAHAIDGWLARPVIGNGWLTYCYYWHNGDVTVIAHNEILNLLYGVGLVGMVVFVFLAFVSFRIAFQTIRGVLEKESLSSKEIYPYVALLGVQLFLLIYGCTTGELLAKPITFVPYLVSIFSAFALKARLTGAIMVSS